MCSNSSECFCIKSPKKYFMNQTAYQNTDKTSRVWALYPDKTLLVSILYIKNTNMHSLFFLYDNIHLSQFEPLFWVQRETVFVECFLSRSKNSQHVLYWVYKILLLVF